MALISVNDKKEVIAEYLKEVLQKECETWLVFECYFSDLSFKYYMHVNESYGNIPSMGFMLGNPFFKNSNLMEIKVKILEIVCAAICQLRIKIEIEKLNKEVSVL